MYNRVIVTGNVLISAKLALFSALLLYQAKSNELERKIHESEEQSRRLKSQREMAEQEMTQMESELTSHIEEKEELVRSFSNLLMPPFLYRRYYEYVINEMILIYSPVLWVLG